MEVLTTGFIIGSDRDIIDAIDTYDSELSKLVERRLESPQEITPELKERVLNNSDYYAYESQLDSNNSAFYDIIEACEAAQKLIEGRINKSKLQVLINDIYKLANNQI